MLKTRLIREMRANKNGNGPVDGQKTKQQAARASPQNSWIQTIYDNVQNP